LDEWYIHGKELLNVFSYKKDGFIKYVAGNQRDVNLEIQEIGKL